MSDERTPENDEERRLLRLKALERDLAESQADIEAGRLVNAETVLDDIQRRLDELHVGKREERSA